MKTKQLDYNNPVLRLSSLDSVAGKVTWQSPSNIALIKYWGKFGKQLPRNPSLSLTLDRAHTRTSIAYTPRRFNEAENGISLNFTFEGEAAHPFGTKVKAYLESLLPILPFLDQLHLEVDSCNSFPHSSGIASSASAMSALALCLCGMEQALFHTLEDDRAFRQKASFLGRLGSGSACRSVFPIAALWGHWPVLPDSSDLYALPCEKDLHPAFAEIHDAILIVDRNRKAVSSRAGHALMEDNPFAGARYAQARERLAALWTAMRDGDLMSFGQIVEAEALALHALMLCSDPPYILLRPNTLQIISRVRELRESAGIPAFISLDAGPNVHILYPASCRKDMLAFIAAELVPFCQDGQWIDDKVGQGPVQLSLE